MFLPTKPGAIFLATGQRFERYQIDQILAHLRAGVNSCFYKNFAFRLRRKFLEGKPVLRKKYIFLLRAFSAGFLRTIRSVFARTTGRA